MSATETIFGPIVTGGDVEDWVFALLARWFGTYLAELERQHGLAAGDLARPRSWVTTNSLDNWPEDQLPSVLVISTGLAGQPAPAGDGLVRARWLVGLACICSARTQAETHRQAMLYVAAARTLLLQRQSLEGHAAGVDWLEERYDELAYDDRRSLAAGQAIFAIDVDGVVSVDGGPITPDDPLDPETTPWPLWPTVETHDVDVSNVTVDQSLQEEEP